MKHCCDITLFRYASHLAEWLYGCGRERTAETYIAAVRSFLKFRHGEAVKLRQIDMNTITAYDYFLRSRGLSANTISFYIRNLRAIYNRAVDEGLVDDVRPFRRAYTGLSKTAKRAVGVETVKMIAGTDFGNRAALQFAADMFLFSFYTRGMAFVDIASLRYENICNGYLVYNRRKTGQQIVVRWEECMQQIVDRYSTSSGGYIFPIIKGKSPRREYLSASHAVNRNLKKIGEILGLEMPLTLYVARHSWASIAYDGRVAVSVISRALGHSSESTTKIYLASLDNSVVDDANRLVLRAISF